MLPTRRTRRVSKPDGGVGVAAEPDRLPEVGTPSAPVKRPGYPVIEDPEHPLWDAQQNLWSDYTPWEAQRALVEHSNKHQRRANSSSHPAFQSSYIKNDQAEREAVVDVAPREVPTNRR